MSNNWRTPYPPPYPGEPWPPPPFIPMAPYSPTRMLYDGPGVVNGPNQRVMVVRSPINVSDRKYLSESPSRGSPGRLSSPRNVISPSRSPARIVSSPSRIVSSPMRRIVSPPPVLTAVPPRRITSPIRQRPFSNDDPKSEPVVYNAAFSFRMGDRSPSKIHKHIEVEPASTVPNTESSRLTSRIDKFLKKSDHTLDRWEDMMKSRSGARNNSRTTIGDGGSSAAAANGYAKGRRHAAPLADEEDLSLSLSLSARAKTSAANAAIAVRADKHMKTIGQIGHGPRVGGAKKVIKKKESLDDDSCSSSDIDSLDDFDDSSDDEAPRRRRIDEALEFSDDTSAEISKVKCPV